MVTTGGENYTLKQWPYDGRESQIMEFKTSHISGKFHTFVNKEATAYETGSYMYHYFKR